MFSKKTEKLMTSLCNDFNNQRIPTPCTRIISVPQKLPKEFTDILINHEKEREHKIAISNMDECNVCANYPLCNEDPKICGGKRIKTCKNYYILKDEYEKNRKEMKKKRNTYKRSLNRKIMQKN